MKKYLLVCLTLISLCIAENAGAFFFLPPFKLDVGFGAQKGGTTANTIGQKAEEQIQKVATEELSGKIGSGSLEQFDFTKNKKSGVEYSDPNSVNAKVAEGQAKESETKDKAAKEVANKTREINKKIAELDANNLELNKMIIEDPKHAKKYRKKIHRNEEEKTKLSKKLVDDTRSVHISADEEIKKIKQNIDKLKATFKSSSKEIFGAFKTIPSNYDSTEDLQKQSATIAPAEGEEPDMHTVAAYKTIHRKNYAKKLMNTIGRAGNAKAKIEENDRKTNEQLVAVDKYETSGGSIGGLIAMKTDNIQSMLNYSELLLQKIQFMASRDLVSMDFDAINPKQATGRFNLDNYKFTPPTETELAKLKADEKEKLGKLDDKIVPETTNVLKDAYKNMAVQNKGKQEAEEE